MKISKNCVVTLDYSVADFEGDIVDGGATPIVYLHGGYEGIFPKIELELEGKAIGESFDIRLDVDDAFGEYDEDLVEVEDRSAFPDYIAVGMQFTQGEEGESKQLYMVTEITDDKVVLDGNHPLAGMGVIFSCTVTAVREASAEEIKNGYAIQS